MYASKMQIIHKNMEYRDTSLKRNNMSEIFYTLLVKYCLVQKLLALHLKDNALG